MFTIRNSTKLTISLCVSIMFFIAGSNISFAETNKLDTPQNNKRAQTIKKLNEIIIDRIDFEDITVPTAVEQLQKISGKHGINIILKLNPQKDKGKELVDFVMVKRSLMDVIYYFSMSTTFHYHIGDNEVVISSIPNPVEIREYRQYWKKENAALLTKKLQNIRIPNIKFINADIYTVVEELNRLMMGNNSPISILIGHEANVIPEFPKVTMDLKNVSMYEILQNLCQDNELKYRFGRYAVILFYDSTKRHTNKAPADNAIRKKLKASIEFMNLKIQKYLKSLRFYRKSMEFGLS